MADKGKQQTRRGREATTRAILDAAIDVFSARGYSGATVREIAAHAGVSHPVVHEYIGTKADILRAVLVRNEGRVASAAPPHLDLLESARLMLRFGLAQEGGRAYVRLLARSALDGLPYDRTTGRFEATERLIDLAEQAAASAAPGERAAKDINPRLVVACAVSLLIAWAATESWLRPAAGLEDMPEAELLEGLERVVAGILRENVPGVERGEPATG